MKTTKITKFFTRESASTHDASDTSSVESPPTKSVRTNNDNASEGDGLQIPVNDISNICCRPLSDNEKYNVIVHAWVPDDKFKFPVSTKRNLKFQLKWLQQFPWLTYSVKKDGSYCRYCVAFSSQKLVGKGGHQNLNVFVATAFRDWKRALEKFKEHQEKSYHKSAMVDGQNFKLIFEKKKDDVLSEIDSGRKKQQLENRAQIAPIVRTVLLCGRQGIALRGHRDHGPLSLEMPEENDGNFRALLRFAISSGDESLKMHMETAAANATYLSYRIQNEIIEAGGSIILNNLVQRVNRSQCFAVLADESPDINGEEQFSISARYVHEIDGKFTIREDFLSFVVVRDVTGQGLAGTLLSTLRNLGVDVNFMRAQGYDGAPSMSGQHNGCAAKVRELCPNALYVHCANHNLNLAITHACDIAPIRNCMGTIKEIVNYFHLSCKAGSLLKNEILKSCPTAKQTRLLKFCETRWVEHLSSLNLFFEVFEHICVTLQDLDEKNTKSDGSKPHTMLMSICTPQFIVALAVLVPIFSLTKNLSIFLQKENCDLARCVKHADNLLEEIKDRRRNAEKEFEQIFFVSTELANKIGVEIMIPRRVGRQLNRDNYEGDAKDYFRRSIFIPFLDHYSDQLQSRFVQHRALLSKIQNILPNKCSELDNSELDSTADCFKTEWPNDFEESIEEFVCELKTWRRYCSNLPNENRFDSFIDALNACDSRFYPMVSRFLKIGATLPVSVAPSERSFSTLRRLKTYLRNRTGEDRLNGLALLNIHRDIEVTPNDVIDVLAKSPRRLDITL